VDSIAVGSGSEPITSLFSEYIGKYKGQGKVMRCVSAARMHKELR